MPESVRQSLSKSRYISGRQCPKRLWTEVRAPELVPPVDRATLARFDQGHQVGSLARELYPGGLEIGPGTRRWDRVVADTRRALTQRRPLYEAAFRAGDGACRVDILVPVTGDRWDVLEVKSSTGVKDVHYSDLALQAHVLDASGLPARDFYLVHIDSTYVRGGSLDPQSLFRRARVTEVVRERQRDVAANLLDMKRTLDSDQRPEIPIGPHCTEPYECPLKAECWAFLPPRNVFDLIRGRSRGFEFLSDGILELDEIPMDAELDRRQRIQLAAGRSGEAHVHRETLQRFLVELDYPLWYFDIETFSSAIPVFDESRPYQQIPFLFSVHRVEGPGAKARHFAYIFAGQGDPRADFLRAVRSALGTEGSIVAYNASFEKAVLQECAQVSLPELVGWSEAIGGRFVDLLRPFRDFSYYHPEQLGKTSLKAVLGPLTGMSYADLKISDGESASREYLRLISTETDAVERAQVMRQLEEYCALDTLGMVAIVDRLLEIVG